MSDDRRRNHGVFFSRSALLILCASLALGQRLEHVEVKVDAHCAVDLDAAKTECVVTLDGDGSEEPDHPKGKDHEYFGWNPEAAICT
ncbi:MAG: hypothetical protein QM757_08565 [Paludibaculum sp.]